MDNQWPVSAKGLLRREGRILLAANDRGEWELPGGHVEELESPEEALVREFSEETRLAVRPGRLVGASFFTPVRGRVVLLLFYTVHDVDPSRPPTLSSEHQEFRWAPISDLPTNLPPVYQKAVMATWGDVAGGVLDALATRLNRDRGGRMGRLGPSETTVPVIGGGGGRYDH